MRIFELSKPKSPEQLRLDQLKVSSKRATDALKVERERQKAQRVRIPTMLTNQSSNVTNQSNSIDQRRS
jgi:hypothetical protein